MSQDVDNFTENLRKELTAAEEGLKELDQELENFGNAAAAKISERLEKAKAGLEQKKQQAKDSRDRVKAYLESKANEKRHEIQQWKHDREVAKLNKRAEKAQEHAADAVVVAMEAMEQARVAVLDAIEARLEFEQASQA